MADNHHTEERRDGDLFATLVLLLIGAAVGSLWTLALVRLV